MTRRPGSQGELARPARPIIHLARDVAPHLPSVRVATNTWRRVGRGIYVPSAVEVQQRTDALARIIGVHEQARVDHCFSHESAALIHGLPLWTPSRATHLYQSSSPSSRRLRTIHRHVPLPPPDDIETIDDVPATTVIRTVWDCVSTMPALDGLVIADAALHAGLDGAALAERVAGARGRRGVARARAILAWNDGGSESPWETACRFVLLRSGFPPPQTQVPVVTRLGTFWADLGWEEWRVLLEYDGRTKYASRGDEELMREKRRHDAIVEAGWHLLRVTRDDFRVRGSIAARVSPLLPPAVTRSLRPRPELA